MSDYLTNAEADCLCFAVRYALDRSQTTAPLIVVDEVVRKWPHLRYWQQQQMHNEIGQTLPRPLLWQRVLTLSLKDKP